MQFYSKEDTIVALATPAGVGALGVIRLSGRQAIDIAQKFIRKTIFRSSLPSQTSLLFFAKLAYPTTGEILDEAMVSVYFAPRSFTGEDVVEFSCHGSLFILQEVLKISLEQGARLAQAGEFTQRAFLNGRMDLAQAEAIADLIASDSKASHQLAMSQMRGGFSDKIKQMREDLIRLAALLELELDFSEEDVEFANRTELYIQNEALLNTIQGLINSYSLGNVMKNGFPVAIIGKPNAGKSTLLNALLEEERAIVSSIAGTTRDTIEEQKNIGGIRFRFIDTAGLRETEDIIEKMGIERTIKKIKEAQLILYLFDMQTTLPEELLHEVETLNQYEIPYFLIGNKMDLLSPEALEKFTTNNQQRANNNFLPLSAQNKANIATLEEKLLAHVQQGQDNEAQIIISNARHLYCLQNALNALKTVKNTLDSRLSTEMVASDLREAIYHLGEIVGEVSNNDLLDFIFSKFCIGK
jgi:tRNA modification GTPase